MSKADDLIQEAKRIRQKLRYQPNAVPDTGIDLTRKSTAYKGDEIPPGTPPKRKLGDMILNKMVEDQPIKFPINLDNVLAAVSEYYRIPQGAIRGPCRSPAYVKARRMVVFIAMRILPKTTFSSIGRKLKKDHTSILYARDTILDLVAKNPNLMIEAQYIEKSIAAQHYH